MKLMTWNIQWCRGVDGRVDPQRIAREARDVVDFDVLCLQEVAVNFPGLAGSRGEDQASQLAAALPGHASAYIAATDVPDGRGGRSQFGNMIFSRLPVKQVFRHLLPWPPDPGFPSMQRALLEAVVAAPFGDLRVMTTHLEYYSLAARVAHVRAIRRLHEEACAHARNRAPNGDPGEPIFDFRPRPAAAILTGDMNFKPGGEEHALILAPFADGSPGFRDAWSVARTAEPHAPTVDVHVQTTHEGSYCCDFVFVTEDLAPRISRIEVSDQSRASDHQPLWVELPG